MGVITNIEDLRILAERRVPRMFYDYADSGSWTESTYRANSDELTLDQWMRRSVGAKVGDSLARLTSSLQ